MSLAHTDNNPVVATLLGAGARAGPIHPGAALLAPCTGLDFTLMLGGSCGNSHPSWAQAASPGLGAAFGIPLAFPHLLQRAPAQPAHKGQPVLLEPGPGAMGQGTATSGHQGTATSGHQGRAVQPEHPWPARRCLPLCGDAAGSVCLGSDGLFPACERLELRRSQGVYK